MCAQPQDSQPEASTYSRPVTLQAPEKAASMSFWERKTFLLKYGHKSLLSPSSRLQLMRKNFNLVLLGGWFHLINIKLKHANKAISHPRSQQFFELTALFLKKISF